MLWYVVNETQNQIEIFNILQNIQFNHYRINTDFNDKTYVSFLLRLKRDSPYCSNTFLFWVLGENDYL